MRENGTGKMYLGFHLDPVHHVHWNNLAAPLEYTLGLPAGVTVSAQSGRAPKVDTVPSDSDPREFLVDVGNWSSGDVIDLQVRYFACDDQDRWCYPVAQRYSLYLQDPQVRGGVYGRSFRMPTRAANSD